MHYRSLFFLIFLGFFASGAYGETVESGEALTLARAIELAVKNHPNIAAGVGTVKANKAKIGEARANYYPQINLTERYSRIGPLSNNPTVVTSDETDRSGIASGNANSFDQYTSTASLSQMVYDFGITSNQVTIQSLTTDSARSDLASTIDEVVFNVKLAYYGSLQAEQNRDVAKDIVKQFQDHLRQAKGFYEAGRSAKFDVTKAAVDLSNAQLSLIKAENQVRLLRVTLNNSLGIPSAPFYTLKDTLSWIKFDLSFENALDKAYLERPDLRSILAKKEAAKESINLSQKGYMPIFSGSANYYYTGSGFPLNHGWNMGVNMTFPLFSGFSTTYQVAQARANLETLSATELSLKQDILLQVQQGYLLLRQAEESITTAELAVKQAQENLGLANDRYRAGVGNPIEVTDSVAALSAARQAYIAALHDDRVAVATIEKAIGAR